jgi:hypothetical protein
MRRAFLALLLACGHRPIAGPPVRAEESAVFDLYTPLSSNREIARRMLTPLTVALGDRVMLQKHEAFVEQPIDLARERFAVYVPPGPPPPEGYGLLVWISPWDEPSLPQLWRPALDRHHLAFVAATNSGNDQKVLDRRVPLALLGWHNLAARFPIDAKRTCVGGLSGGSRVAEMVALAYPDVFRGALLNAGSDPISGESGIYLPPAELFHQFQRDRLVYITGDEDELNQHDDLVSRASMREWCVFDMDVKAVRHLGHAALDPISFDHALDSLDERSPPKESELAACNARIERELAAALQGAAGDRAKIMAIDRRYAGLAGAQLLELDQKL